MNNSINDHSQQNSVAVNVLGTFGAVFWSIQLLPQIWINYRRPTHTEGLQPSMMLLWAAAGLPLGIYNILSNQNVALQVQPQILTLLSLLTWGQVMYYGHNWSKLKTCTVLATQCVLFGSIEMSFIVGYKYGSDSGTAPPSFLLAMSILSAIGLGLGVLRHYYDAITHRSVRGISWIFVGLDAAGDVTSLASVLLSRSPDGSINAEAAAIYATELALWIGLMAMGLLWNTPFFNCIRREPEQSEQANGDHSSVNEETGISSPVEGEREDDADSMSVFHTSAGSRLLQRSRERLQQGLRLRFRRGSTTA